MRVIEIAMMFLLTSCSGSSGFTDGLKLGKESENKEPGETKTGENLGNEKESDDTADQPVQITGTYLTCVETKSSDTSALFGCRVASKQDGSTVDLTTLASNWTFDYDIENNVNGSVKVKSSSKKNYHVLFEFEASSKLQLNALLAATKILLDLTYLPGVAPAGSGSAFAGPITSFIPQSQTDIAIGTQIGPGNSVVENENATPETVSTPPQQPLTTPIKPVDTNTAQGSTTPSDQSTPSGDQPGVLSPSDQITKPSIDPTQPIELDPKDPVAFFSLVKAPSGGLTLQAYFDQTSGLTNPVFTGAKNLSYAGGVPYSDGTAMIMLTTPMSISVNKGGKVCTGSGTIGAGVNKIPLKCS